MNGFDTPLLTLYMGLVLWFKSKLAGWQVVRVKKQGSRGGCLLCA